MTSEKLRQILCAAGLVGYLSWTTAPTAAAATEGSSKTYDWCYASCGAEESCATECENDGGGTITCGEYDEGEANGWCLQECSDVCAIDQACNRQCRQSGSAFDCETYNGGICSNTCENTCNAMTSDGSESCFDDGGFSATCEDYGTLVQCGDGICSPSENCLCADCALFCIPSLSPILKAALPSSPTFNETSIGQVCEAVNVHEWDETVTCPTWSWEEGFVRGNPLCTELQHARSEMNLIHGFMKGLADAYQAQYSCTPNDNSSECVQQREYQQLADDALAAFNYYNTIPCYVDLNFRR